MRGWITHARKVVSITFCCEVWYLLSTIRLNHARFDLCYKKLAGCRFFRGLACEAPEVGRPYCHCIAFILLLLGHGCPAMIRNPASCYPGSWSWALMSVGCAGWSWCHRAYAHCWAHPEISKGSKHAFLPPMSFQVASCMAVSYYMETVKSFRLLDCITHSNAYIVPHLIV